MKNFLFISYYFPPLGMGGVQRSLKFAKYLPEFGWRPVVFTTDNMAYYAYDENLLAELPEQTIIYRSNLLNPLSMAKGGISERKNVQGRSFLSLLKKFSDYFSVLDNKIYWALANLPKAVAVCKKHNISCIFSTSPPHSAHLLSLFLSKILNIPYVIDFRDDWAGGVLDNSPTALHDWLADFSLRLCLKNARFITTTSRLIGESLADREIEKTKLTEKFHVEHRKKYVTITNGYDEADFAGFKHKQTDKFTITYSGTFTPVHHPLPFLRALGELLEENPDWRRQISFRFIGEYFGLDFPSILRQNGLEAVTQIYGYQTHAKVIRNLQYTDMLLLSLTMGEQGKPIIPGKLFEYFRVGKPILAISPENGATAELIRLTKSGDIAEPTNIRKIKAIIKKNFIDWRSRKTKLNHKDITEYERRNLSEKLGEILGEAINGK